MLSCGLANYKGKKLRSFSRFMIRMKQFIFQLLLSMAFCCNVEAQSAPQTASEVLKAAQQQAQVENKNVMIIFHASWCGWCHKMDSSLADKSCRQFFEDNFVIRHLVVDESPDKKKLENPGADALRAKYYGDNQGIPFWLIFDKNGKLLADSQIRPAGASLNSRGENVGCPSEEKEVQHFIDVLKKTSHPTEDQVTAIEKRFRQNAN